MPFMNYFSLSKVESEILWPLGFCVVSLEVDTPWTGKINLGVRHSR